MARQCEIDGCERKHYAKGMCQLHWRRERTNGSPYLVRGCQDAWRKKRRQSFWERVKKSDDCWEWGGFVGANGYGRVSSEGKTALAHRLAYELVNGPIPDGKCVLHACDNRSCVKPAHLFLGSNADNTSDMVEKGRHIKGEDHPNSKLTADAVVQIRRSKEFLRVIAKRYGISIAVASKVRNRTAWRHV